MGYEQLRVACALLLFRPVDRGVLASAHELFEARHYASVVALVSDALDAQPDSVELLIVRARAHMAMRRDLEAQADLRDIIRLDPSCSIAYRLLGELAARRDENECAAIFFREALRLDPDDQDADVWLAIVQATSRPAAAASTLPAPAAAAGRSPMRAAKGTRAPDVVANSDEGVTGRFVLPRPRAESVETVVPAAPDVVTEREVAALPPPPIDVRFKEPPPPVSVRFAQGSSPSLDALPPEPPSRQAFVAGAFHIPPQPREAFHRPAPAHRGSVPELPGFGDYLVEQGILTRERLRAAQAYQRSMKVQLATAIVTLGLATPQRVEWAAVAHQSQLARGG